MQTKIKVHREYDEDHVASITCDICKEVHPYDHWKKTDSFEVLETEISLTEGYSYPEGGSRNILFFDICPKCFREKIVPFLAELGAIPSHKEWDNW